MSVSEVEYTAVQRVKESYQARLQTLAWAASKLPKVLEPQNKRFVCVCVCNHGAHLPNIVVFKKNNAS